MAGDNNLEGAGRDDLAEMKSVGSSDRVDIVVQFDTEANRTTRYYVEKNRLKVLKQMPGVNCGKPKTLTDFLKWGIATFPATHYLVDIWNHGGGWENLPADYDYDSIRLAKPQQAAKLGRIKRALFTTTVKRIHKRPSVDRAIAIDCGSHDYLDNQELRKAVTKALPANRRLDILACDACLMNMIEIAYEMKDTARFLVGSEETEPAAGWPYAAILKALVAKPEMNPADLAKLVVVKYGEYYSRRREKATQSALDLSRISDIARAVNGLAEALIADMLNVAGAVSLARDKSLKFEMPEYIDLGDFARQLGQRLPQHAQVQSAIDGIQKALKTPPGAFVISNAVSGSAMARASGVSIYFPRTEDYAPDYRDLRFSKDGKWIALLQALAKA
jgi:hypothetical protein